MIERLTSFPDYVVAVRASGEVTRSDYLQTVVPAAEMAMEKHAKVRVFMEIDEDADPSLGMIMEDAVFATRHLMSWGRIAIVSDAGWVKRAYAFLRPILPFEMKLFSKGEANAARIWITEDATTDNG
ncbi:STAS/SEC14 domain-containing protein [Stappia sp. F7233]|uniref:STAS/SEC14 domain-containing protein n=1 Tax=Stappia albiluteola TaxID=2758565 RepID=A0A839A9F3_9HYPH|nr:STAS/SEC14 domain-containing protein [Stappia albiluteola]MBA5775674.1 STAS/SEC14 domain-containing protein [Stappia albiluteola]